MVAQPGDSPQQPLGRQELQGLAARLAGIVVSCRQDRYGRHRLAAGDGLVRDLLPEARRQSYIGTRIALRPGRSCLHAQILVDYSRLAQAIQAR